MYLIPVNPDDTYVPFIKIAYSSIGAPPVAVPVIYEITISSWVCDVKDPQEAETVGCNGTTSIKAPEVLWIE